MWSEHPDFLRVVEEVWNAQITGSMSFRLVTKLKNLKFKLKTWNWEVFGDVKENVGRLQEIILRKEDSVQQEWRMMQRVSFIC